MSSSPNPEAAVSDAPSPFNKYNADIILRSSDLVDYRVYSQVLMAASPFFEGMFEVRQPPPAEQLQKYGLPIICVSEDHKTLDTLLRICYPVPKPNQWALDLIEPALRAAIKYEMEYAETVLTAELQNHLSRPLPPDSTEPLAFRVWTIACRLHLDEVARCAAAFIRPRRQTSALVDADMFHLPRMILESPDGYLEDVTAGQYFRLCRFLTDPATGAQGVDGAVLFTLPPSTTRTPDDFEGYAHRVTPDPSTSLTAPPADLICISSDQVCYRVHKAVLSAASPVLRKKITAACEDKGLAPSALPVVLTEGLERGTLAEVPTPEAHSCTLLDDLPICRFDESSRVLSYLFSSCYPGGLRPANYNEDPLDDLPLLVRVHKAVARYEIDPTLDVHSRLHAAWHSAASKNPLRAYFMAIQCEHATCARIAAEYVLSQGKLRLDDAAYVPEMETSPAMAYRRLIKYYCSCKALGRKGLRDLRANLLALPPTAPECSSPREPKPMKCESGKKKSGGKTAKSVGAIVEDGPTLMAPKYQTWLDKYIERLRDAFENSPRPTTLHDLNGALKETIKNEESGPWCEECMILVQRLLGLDDSLQQLARRMDEVVLEV
ncbi:hypothetical protein C8Q73DRAFT_791311 [Cubamyces lactineus]|nr:hypothetical protein C8Q73DRAFT_791311 [Cubamyces lactineus]